MAVIMKRITLISVICTFFFFLLYQSLSMKLWFSLSITCGTVAFHFGIRLLVGFLYDLIMRNRGKYWKRWYQLKEWEPLFTGISRLGGGNISCLHMKRIYSILSFIPGRK